MATDVRMPRQGQSVETCLILEWKKNEGDPVKVGDILCEVETDKATFEVEAPAEGVLLKILQPEGAEVPVLDLIAYIGQEGEEIPEPVSAAADDTPASAEAPDTAPASGAAAPRGAAPEQSPTPEAPATVPAASPAIAPAVSPQDPSSPRKVSPRARRLAASKGLPLEDLTGTGPGGRIVEKDVRTALAERAPLSPAAVAALGPGLEAPLRGSGPGGRVLRADLVPSRVAKAVPATAYASAALAAAEADFPGAVEEIPVKGIRKIIAERMLASLRDQAQLTMNSSADARALQGFRLRLKESAEDRGLKDISLNDLLLFTVSRVLPHFPELNAHWLEDRILRFQRVHLGFAVDTPRGLMVPVIRNADLLSLKALSAQAKDLAQACLEGSIKPDQLSGGTFTVTNLGALGIESFTPVLNSPQAAILGVSAIGPKPVFVGEAVEFIPALGLSLTIDHQAVDGAPGARFLKELAETIARFDLILAKG